MTIDLHDNDVAADVLAVMDKNAMSPEQGVAVLLPGGASAAVFLLHDGSVHAVGNIDPYYGAPVICHGIVGDRAGRPVVASPLGKQVFCLGTGQCLDDPGVSLPVYGVAVAGGVIRLSAPGVAGGSADRPS
ncbi:MAG TPA: nitrite reductase (NAD(P)H) small subunit [Trebonia sp.]